MHARSEISDRHRELTSRIIAAFHYVFNALGPGLPEAVYSRALIMALRARGLSCRSEVHVPVYFEGRPIGRFRLDIVVEGVIVIEIKAKSRVEPVHEAQVLTYLGNTHFELGLLLNFGPTPTVRRFIYSNDRKARLAAGEANLRV